MALGVHDYAGDWAGAGGAGGFGAAADVAEPAGFGAGEGAGLGSEITSSHTAAQIPHVWILLVDALQGWAPQFGQWCSFAMRGRRRDAATYAFRVPRSEWCIREDARFAGRGPVKAS